MNEALTPREIVQLYVQHTSNEGDVSADGPFVTWIWDMRLGKGDKWNAPYGDGVWPDGAA